MQYTPTRPTNTAGRKSNHLSQWTFGKGRSQPPRKSVVATEATTIMLAYSPKEIERPAEAAVFRHVPGDQFGFRFGKIEGSAIGFGDGGDQENEKAHGRHENKPDVTVELRSDDIGNSQRTGEQQGADDGDATSRFVADKLSGTADGADDGVMAIGGPAAKNDAKKTERADADDEQDTDVDILRDAESRAEVHRAHCGERSNHRDDGSKPENQPVGISRNEVFLDQQLHRIGNGLQQAMRANTHRAEPRLHVCHELALDEHDVARDQWNDRDDHHGADEFDPPVLQEMRRGLGRWDSWASGPPLRARCRECR